MTNLPVHRLGFVSIPDSSAILISQLKFFSGVRPTTSPRAFQCINTYEKSIYLSRLVIFFHLNPRELSFHQLDQLILERFFAWSGSFPSIVQLTPSNLWIPENLSIRGTFSPIGSSSPVHTMTYPFGPQSSSKPNPSVQSSSDSPSPSQPSDDTFDPFTIFQ